MATNRGANILDAITQLTPLLAGSGTTKASTTQAKSGNTTAINALVNLLSSDVANPAAAGSVVKGAQKNAIELMLQRGVPQIASAERGSGIFNSSQTQQAISQLEGQTAAAAAQLEVDQANKAAQTTTQASEALNQATGTTTTAVNQKTAPVIDPVMSALGLGGMFLGSQLFKKGGLLDFSSDTGLGGAQQTSDFTPVTKTPDLLSSLDLSGFTNSVVSGLKNATFDSVTGTQNTGGVDDLLGAIGSVATSSIFSGLSNIFSGIFGGGGSSASQSGIGGTSGDTGTTFGCFITTAVCEFHNKPDDCDELQTLRKFRDEYMRPNTERAKLVIKYYSEAPRIVEAIDTIPYVDRKPIYERFYNAFIKPAVSAIKEGRNEEALMIYTELFNSAKYTADKLSEHVEHVEHVEQPEKEHVMDRGE